MTITVERITDPELFRRVAKATSGKDVKMTWAKALASGHSIIRAEQYLIEMEDIPLYVASQLVRSHVGVQWYQRSKRTDRGGEDFGTEVKMVRRELMEAQHAIRLAVDHADYDWLEDAERIIDEQDSEIADWPYRFDRYAPTNLTGIMNAEAIINMSHKRFCAKASKETREVWREVVHELAKVDPDLAEHCVPQCVHRGDICPEPKGCGYNRSEIGIMEMTKYKNLFE